MPVKESTIKINIKFLSEPLDLKNCGKTISMRISRIWRKAKTFNRAYQEYCFVTKMVISTRYRNLLIITEFYKANFHSFRMFDILNFVHLYFNRTFSDLLSRWRPITTRRLKRLKRRTTSSLGGTPV